MVSWLSVIPADLEHTLNSFQQEVGGLAHRLRFSLWDFGFGRTNEFSKCDLMTSSHIPAAGIVSLIPVIRRVGLRKALL